MSFEPKPRKPGDLISSSEWNEALEEIARLRGDVDRLVQKEATAAGGPDSQQQQQQQQQQQAAQQEVPPPTGKEPAPPAEFVKKSGDELAGKFSLQGDLHVNGGKVGIGTTSPTELLHVAGRLLGAACDDKGKALRIVCGSTPKGSTAWQVHPGAPNQAVFVDVDTKAAGFKETPLYFTSLHGEWDGQSKGHHWKTTGANAVYVPKPGGFRVFVRLVGPGNPAVTPQFANQDGWHIQWLAVGV